MKFRDYVELYESEKKNVYVFYDQWDMGAKYKIYRKVNYGIRIGLEYVNSFVTQGEALAYAKKIHDCLIER